MIIPPSTEPTLYSLAKLKWQWKVAFYSRKYMFIILPETNIATENEWLEDDISY